MYNNSISGLSNSADTQYGSVIPAMLGLPLPTALPAGGFGNRSGNIDLSVLGAEHRGDSVCAPGTATPTSLRTLCASDSPVVKTEVIDDSYEGSGPSYGHTHSSATHGGRGSQVDAIHDDRGSQVDAVHGDSGTQVDFNSKGGKVTDDASTDCGSDNNSVCSVEVHSCEEADDFLTNLDYEITEIIPTATEAEPSVSNDVSGSPVNNGSDSNALSHSSIAQKKPEVKGKHLKKRKIASVKSIFHCPICNVDELPVPNVTAYKEHIESHSWRCSICWQWQLGYEQYRKHVAKCMVGT